MIMLTVSFVSGVARAFRYMSPSAPPGSVSCLSGIVIHSGPTTPALYSFAIVDMLLTAIGIVVLVPWHAMYFSFALRS